MLNQSKELCILEEFYLDKIEDEIYKEFCIEKIDKKFSQELIDKRLDVLYVDYTKSNNLSIKQYDNKKIIGKICTYINDKISKKKTVNIVLLCIKILNIQGVENYLVQDNLIGLLRNYYAKNNTTSFDDARTFYFPEDKKERSRDKIRSKIDKEVLENSILVILKDFVNDIRSKKYINDFISYFTPLDDEREMIEEKDDDYEKINQKAISWLNDFVSFLKKFSLKKGSSEEMSNELEEMEENKIAIECSRILEEESILPSQSGEFKKLKDLYIPLLKDNPIRSNLVLLLTLG